MSPTFVPVANNLSSLQYTYNLYYVVKILITWFINYIHGFFFYYNTYGERAILVTLFSCSSSAFKELAISICIQGVFGAFQIRTEQSNEAVIRKPLLDQAKQEMESSWALKSSVTRQQSISYTILLRHNKINEV